MKVTKRNGSLEEINLDKINRAVERACEGLSDVSVSEVVLDAHLQMYDGIATKEIDEAMILSACSKVEKEPNYDFVAARLLLNSIYKEVFGISIKEGDVENYYRDYFIINLRDLASVGRINPLLLEKFDLHELANHLKIDRDLQFRYRGIKTLHKQYLLHINGVRKETPQAFFMRVAMGISLKEQNPTFWAKKFYDLYSTFSFMPSTPTLFNSGTTYSQLSSCFLSNMEDSIDGIFGSIHKLARLSKYAGGLATDITNIRASGSYIHGTNGISHGIVPWLKVLNDMTISCNQCFSPDTRIYTNKGVVNIEDIKINDEVLTLDNKYHKVLDVMEYDQTDEMVEIELKHSLFTLKVTSGHPIYVIRNWPRNKGFVNLKTKLDKYKKQCEWVEAGKLTINDLVALPIPETIEDIADFTEDDAYFYGLMLGDGSIYDARNKAEAAICLNNTTKADLVSWVYNYLNNKGVHHWTSTDEPNEKGEMTVQIRWTHRNFNFGYFDLYTGPSLEDEKCISVRLAHLPKNKAIKLIKGLIRTDGGVYRGKEIHFYNSSIPLLETFRYQLLRFGMSTSATFVKKVSNFSGRNKPVVSEGYDVRVPMFPELNKELGITAKIHRYSFFTYGNNVFTRINNIKSIVPVQTVYDLKVQCEQNYSTTNGVVHNGGKRPGVCATYLEPWHLDIEDYLQLRKSTGDERRRAHELHTALWVPDLFMEYIEQDKDWYLFCPHECPELHTTFGDAFKRVYLQYVKKARAGLIKNFKVVNSKQLWKEIIRQRTETGYPYICFKDSSNYRYPNKHEGVVYDSNLCSEIIIHNHPSKWKDGELTELGETAVCVLGSVNLIAHQNTGNIQYDKLANTVSLAIRHLDNVIENGTYPIPEATKSSLRHRNIGLGRMGWQDLLNIKNIPYDSQSAVELAGDISEFICYTAINASCDLAKERGTYLSYKNSEWDKGNLTHDLWDDSAAIRNPELLSQETLNWRVLRDRIKQYGMRNANLLATAPNATISTVIGVSPSIEAQFSVLFVYSTQVGDFTIVNPYFVAEMKKRGIWCKELADALKKTDGDVSNLKLPEDIKNVYKSVFNMDFRKVIDVNVEMSKWIDQAQSFNIYYSGNSMKEISDLHFYCWKNLLKTTYYFRTKAASKVEKNTCSIEDKLSGNCQSCEG